MKREHMCELLHQVSGAAICSLLSLAGSAWVFCPLPQVLQYPLWRIHGWADATWRTDKMRGMAFSATSGLADAAAAAARLPVKYDALAAACHDVQ
jgi:hypothetical protein